ncbi:MAG: CoA transferase [Actinomycetota bacterium]
MTHDDVPDLAGPLAGVRVLDLSAGLGRFAGKMLAEFGADVLRVGVGERGPELDGAPGDAPRHGLLDWWHDCNCRRLPLDLDDEADRQRFLELVDRCDVLIDVESPGTMAARGLAPSDLAERNPRLVHISLSPFGADGPRADWRSSDLVAQALGGYLSVTGDPDEPIALWGRQAATVGGMYAAMSALAGLHRARTTGRGSWVDLSLHEAVISCSEHVLMYWWFPEALEPLGAPIAARQRSLHWIRAFEVVPCERGACMVSPAAGGLLDLIAWLKARGHAQSVPDDPDDEVLLSLIPPMMEALKAAALEMDATDLFEAGQSLHVPFGESYTVPQVAEAAQHRHREYFRPVEEGIAVPGPVARFVTTAAPGPVAPQDCRTTDPAAIWPDREADPEAAVDVGEATDQVASSAATAVDGDLVGPLAGVRVLDFTHVLAGPFATRVMADLGADVIRLQTEERMGGSSANEFPYNVMWCRSKRAIQLQMKHEEALDVLAALVAEADVVIDNFSAGVMAEWGAGPEQLQEWTPGIISLSMSGCGTDGPWQDYVTYAPTVHALCGFTALTGPPGQTDCGPGIAYNDHVSGLTGAIALLSALDHRNRTGEGQHIEISQYEVGTYLIGPAMIDFLATGRAAEANGNVDAFADHVVNEVFQGRDGDWLAVTLFDQSDWEAALALGVAPVPDGADGKNRTESVGAWVAARDAGAAQDELQAAGLAAGVVQTADHMANRDPQLAHRDWLVTMDSPMQGSQTTERHPARWFDRAGELPLQYRPTAYLGEHNFEVYQELLGWDAERVAIAMGTELIQ